MSEEKELIFVNGDLYTGEVIYSRWRGMGWESGRTAGFLIKPKVKETAEVFIVDLEFGKLRHCRLVPKGTYTLAKNGEQEWEAIDETEAEILVRLNK